MQADRCLHVCILGDTGVGQSSFLRCYRGVAGAAGAGNNFSTDGKPFDDLAKVESVVAMIELDEEPCRVRFTDGVGGPFFRNHRNYALGAAHAVMMCFRSGSRASLDHIRDYWLPLYWSAGAKAPWILVCLQSDVRESKKAVTGELGQQIQGGFVDSDEAQEFANRYGAFAYRECSAFFPETVQQVADEALFAAGSFYNLQWQLPGDSAGNPPPPDEVPWLFHERLNVTDDTKPVTTEEVKSGLSQLGETGNRQHAYLRCDLVGMSLTSLDKLRPFLQLQFLNVSRNQLRTIEPLGEMRNLLHLNISHNSLIRTDSFTAPEGLETVDMSYNMITEIGEWKMHRYLRELNLRGNFLKEIGPGLLPCKELRMLDLSENHISRLEHLDNLELRTLHVAQNWLTSLEGVSTLSKLQVLDARHNNITSTSILQVERMPRLRKLCLAENRISEMGMVESLSSFPFLCDLYLHPNPVSQLPYYRAQVIHRLPRLRSLDSQQVSAEERVKTDLIYGADVECRREIFEQLLPEETFVDRRLVTEEIIADMEIDMFGCNGNAGAYGRQEQQELGADMTFSIEGQQRTQFQHSQFKQRLAMARTGGHPEGVADFMTFAAPFLTFSVCDTDLPEILEAVAEGGIVQLLLGAADLTANGIRELLAFLPLAQCKVRHVDLTGCKAVREVESDLLSKVPLAKGFSVEAENCGLSSSTVTKLRNEGQEREDARRAVLEQKRKTAAAVAAYMAKQKVLEELCEELAPRDTPPEPTAPYCHPKMWQPGREGYAKASYNEFLQAGNQSGLTGRYSIKGRDGTINMDEDEYRVLNVMRDRMLEEWGIEIPEPEEAEGEAPAAGDGEVEAEEDDDDGEDYGPPPFKFSESRRFGQADVPLPEAFAAIFGSDPADVRQSNHLLGFMLWEGVTADDEKVQALKRERKAWEAKWFAEQNRLKIAADSAAAAYDATQMPGGVGSGQLVAHFSYLCQPYGLEPIALKQPSHFGFKRVSETPRPNPAKGSDLFSAIAAEKVILEFASGQGFGLDAINMKLRNPGIVTILVAVRRGTIFQHVTWEHRQNLMVSMDYVVEIAPGASVLKSFSAHCMNLNCACSSGNPMALTEFYIDNDAIIGEQVDVWDHFNKVTEGP
eukprot:TRINITY_DN11862_c1_g6_i1.p1 TRINITY_DN11862_c1_g6~~TRINITY_DN11862_c1_g6_i1.p1  ORF type:complete len:1129 (-),score=239.47 TRINITY_DN11862_c1_g6_i1:167-3553(-)